MEAMTYLSKVGLDIVRDPWDILNGAVVHDTTHVDVVVGISIST
jgi:hypothetical protein